MVGCYPDRKALHVFLTKPENIDTHLFNLDVFIRIRDMNGEWQPWEREQLTARMWTLAEVLRLVRQQPAADLIGVYKDDFGLWRDGEQEPGLAYIAIKKR